MSVVDLSAKTDWKSAIGTWEYASATTITVPSGATAIYDVGDTFKLTANEVELQGYIVKVADALLTVAGDTLTDHDFSNCYFSKNQRPHGFDEWFDTATPVADLAGIDDGSGGQPSIATSIFRMVGGCIHVRVKFSSAFKVSAGVLASIAVPTNLPNLDDGTWTAIGSAYFGNGVYVPGTVVRRNATQVYMVAAASIADNVDLSSSSLDFMYIPA